MTHDIDDLLEMIRALEERVIQLELTREFVVPLVTDDSYYWEHG